MAKFENLTKVEQQVVIAKDLLARLRAKQFKPTQGTYLSVNLSAKVQENREAEVRDALRGKVCKGCQIGGMFLCAVDRHNELSLHDMGRVDSEPAMRRYLRRWFSDAQLKDVESAFEGWGRYYLWEGGTPTQRMEAIAKNIIKNKGRFVGGQLLNGSK